jgi:tyrosyl-tRNA synthetase
VSLDGEKVTDVKMQVEKDSIGAEGIVLKRGKKKFMRVVLK